MLDLSSVYERLKFCIKKKKSTTSKNTTARPFYDETDFLHLSNLRFLWYNENSLGPPPEVKGKNVILLLEKKNVTTRENLKGEKSQLSEKQKRELNYITNIGKRERERYVSS